MEQWPAYRAGFALDITLYGRTGMVRALDTLSAIDRRVLEFTQEPANALLRPLTRSFCTPFRGTLFGRSTLVDVQSELSRRPVAALVLGTNPSIANANDSKFRSMQEHIAGGLYGETYWNSDGTPRAGWQSSQSWRWERQQYEPLRAAGVPLDEVAFANYVPWGSPENAKNLVKAMEPALLRRVIGLADEIFLRMLKLLRPRIVVAQASISNNLPHGTVARHRETARRGSVRYQTKRGDTRTFNYDVGPLSVDGMSIQVLHVPHPSSWKMSTPSRDLVVDQLTAEVRKLLS